MWAGPRMVVSMPSAAANTNNTGFGARCDFGMQSQRQQTQQTLSNIATGTIRPSGNCEMLMND